MERKQKTFIEVLVNQAHERTNQLMLEGLSGREAKERATAELKQGLYATWPGHEIVESLKTIAYNGIRIDIDKAGGSIYKRGD